MTDHLKQAFADEGRSRAAAARAGQRAVAKVVAALPEDEDQRGAVLAVALKRPGVREPADAVGIHTSADLSFGEQLVAQAREAIEAFQLKKGSVSADVQTALDTFMTIVAAPPQQEALKRGRQAKRARAAGEAVAPAVVTGAREYAEQFGMSLGAAYKRLKRAVERRAKLSELEHGIYWVASLARTGHGLSKETKALVHQFYLDHPGIKRSPLRGDVLHIKDEHGVRQPVAKLLSEVSLTDVYLDFEKAHPGLLKERAFRYLAPPELRRMTRRHLDMCGCRWSLYSYLCLSPVLM